MTADQNRSCDVIFFRNASYFANEARAGRSLHHAGDLIEWQSARIDTLTCRLNMAELVKRRALYWAAIFGVIAVTSLLAGGV